MPVDVKIEGNAIEGVKDLIGRVENINDVIGSAAARLTSDYLATLDSQRPNALGGRRSHFYAAAARSVRYAVNLDGATVTVAKQGMAQRYYGGTIYPTAGHEYITVPARGEAVGHFARDFNNLHFVHFKSGSVALVENDATKISIGKKGVKNKGATGGLVFYWCVPSVHQDPDPSVIPSPVKYDAAVLAGCQPWLEGKKN